MKPSIQRRVLPVLLAAALLGGCGPQGGDPDLEFPQTGWEMKAEQVMEAWGTTPEEVGNRTPARTPDPGGHRAPVPVRRSVKWTYHGRICRQIAALTSPLPDATINV